MKLFTSSTEGLPRLHTPPLGLLALLQGLIVARADLKARDYQIDLAAKLNKTQVGTESCHCCECKQAANLADG